MKKLTSAGQRWLKILHLLAASVWLGCAAVLTVLAFTYKATTGGELYGIRATMDFIDLFILVPGAMATFFTALVYSIWTRWGWFKHRWVTVKWIICLFGILFGTFFLGPWSSFRGFSLFGHPDRRTLLPVLEGNRDVCGGGS